MQIPVESLNLLMLNVGFARHNHDWNWQNINSPFTRIYYVVKGGALLHFKGETVGLHPGHLYMVPANKTHSYECRGVFEHYYLHVYEGFKKETDVFEWYDFPTEVDAQTGDESLFADMCKAHPEAQLPESDPRSYDNSTTFADYVRRYNQMALWEKMQLRGAILILFSRFMKNAAPKMWTRNERMAKVLTYVHDNIYKDINVDILANLACITKPYLIRTFKREFNESPLCYINRKKVERAQLLLLTSDIPVKEIAYTLGFNDHSYFSRLFKKITGTTPQEYRKMNDV